MDSRYLFRESARQKLAFPSGSKFTVSSSAADMLLTSDQLLKKLAYGLARGGGQSQAC